jgi:3-oxoacyl-[acyl-carrier protein] reductase
VVSLDQAADPPVDLASDEQVRAAAAAVLGRHGRCDVLVHAGAAFDKARLADLDLTAWRRVQAVNVEARPCLARWCPATWPPRWRSSPPTAPPR